MSDLCGMAQLAIEGVVEDILEEVVGAEEPDTVQTVAVPPTNAPQSPNLPRNTPGYPTGTWIERLPLSPSKSVSSVQSALRSGPKMMQAVRKVFKHKGRYPAPGPISHDEGELPRYEVACIVAKEERDGVDFYRVGWKGWAPDSDTWEPRANLDECEELIAEFETRNESVTICNDPRFGRCPEGQLSVMAAPHDEDNYSVLSGSVPSFASTSRSVAPMIFQGSECSASIASDETEVASQSSVSSSCSRSSAERRKRRSNPRGGGQNIPCTVPGCSSTFYHSRNLTKHLKLYHSSK